MKCVRQYQMVQFIANRVTKGKEKKMGAENICEKKSDWKLPKFGERHRFTDLRRSVNSKPNKTTENCTQPHHNQTAENQR